MTIRIKYFMLLLVSAVSVSFASDTLIQHIQVTQTNIASVPFTAHCTVYAGVGQFWVDASPENGERGTMQISGLWIYDHKQHISDCSVRPVREVDGKFRFHFNVSTNYFDSSKFILYYGTTNNWSVCYSIYLKDFSYVK